MLFLKNRYKLDLKIDKYFGIKLLEKKKDLEYIFFELFYDFSKNLLKTQNINFFIFFKNKFFFNFQSFIIFLKSFFSFNFFVFFDLKYIDCLFSNSRLNFFINYFKNKFYLIKSLNIKNFYSIFCNYNLLNSYGNNIVLKIFSIFKIFEGSLKEFFLLSDFIIFFNSFKYFFSLIFDHTLSDRNSNDVLMFFNQFKVYKNNQRRDKYRRELKYKKINKVFFFFKKYIKYFNIGYLNNLSKIRLKHIKYFKKMSKKYKSVVKYKKLARFRNNKSIFNLLKIENVN